MKVIQSFVFLLVLIVSGVISQEVCLQKCDAEYGKSEENVHACKGGCRLAVIINMAASDEDVKVLQDKCKKDCAKSFNQSQEREACSFGCANQPNGNSGSVEVSMSEKDPMFKVVQSEMDKAISRMFGDMPMMFGRGMGMGPYRRGYHHPPMMMMGSNWGFPMRGVGMWRGRGNNAEDDVSGGSSEEEGGAIVLQSGEDPFLAMHRKMHEDMMRFHQIADRLLSLGMDRDRDSGENSAENERANSKEDKMVFQNRPKDHTNEAFLGPSVGNQLADGSVVIHTQPVGGEINNHLLGYMGENPNAYQESSRIISHVRHLSTVSQWLVCVALLLCLISMLAISIAILKQIKARRYHNLRTIVPAQVIVPGQLGEPIPAKKIPLGSSPSAAEPNTYPLIHDSPPPAYDQLSIHKEQPTDAVGAGAGHEETIPEKEPTAHRDDAPNNDDGSHHPNA